MPYVEFLWATTQSCVILLDEIPADFVLWNVVRTIPARRLGRGSGRGCGVRGGRSAVHAVGIVVVLRDAVPLTLVLGVVPVEGGGRGFGGHFEGGLMSE